MKNETTRQELANQASLPRPGIVREVVDFLANNKKWWLTPITLALFLVGILVLLGSTSAAPFIYTLF